MKYAIERLLQLIIDLALDINNMVIKCEGGYPASDYFNSFINLIELNVFAEDFAYKIAPIMEILGKNSLLWKVKIKRCFMNLILDFN